MARKTKEEIFLEDFYVAPCNIDVLLGDLMVVDGENEGQDIVGGIISLMLTILLLTEFALWIKVANYKTNKK